MKIINRRIRFDYKILETFEAGVVLTGSEVKAIKARRVSIKESYARIINGEIYLINANVSINGLKNYDPTRSKKLLLGKSEIVRIVSEIKGKKLTLVPLKLYTKGRLIKLEIALARSKKRFEKRKSLKEADIKRDLDRELKGI